MHVLLSVDVNTVEEIDTMSKIKQEIRKLNTCDGIVSHIIANDLKQERVQCLTSMVCLTEDAVKVCIVYVCVYFGHAVPDELVG